MFDTAARERTFNFSREGSGTRLNSADVVRTDTKSPLRRSVRGITGSEEKHRCQYRGDQTLRGEETRKEGTRTGSILGVCCVINRGRVEDRGRHSRNRRNIIATDLG